MTSNEKLLCTLQKKMSAEQDKFRDWLLNQPPEEILNHTFEYSVREDIVLLMENTSLSNKDLRTLLASPSPLGDVYKAFANMDMSLVDAIQACMEESAHAIERADQYEGTASPKKVSVLSKLREKTSDPPKPHIPTKEGDSR